MTAMGRVIPVAWFCLSAIACFAEQPMGELPIPRYQADTADPPWLAYAARFHGHLGPWGIAGVRAGMAGRRAVEADGYFDIRVVAEGPWGKPPRSCFLDGLQVATGATLGKRNLEWIERDRIVVRVQNTQTGKSVIVRPTEMLMKLLTSFRPQPMARAAGRGDHPHQAGAQRETLERIARKIARLGQSEILYVQAARSEQAQRARDAD